MKRRNRSVVASAITAIALIAAGCAGDEPTAATSIAADAPAPDTTAAPAVERASDSAAPMRIGVVAPSAENDAAWTQSMSDSLDRVAADRDIEVAVSAGLSVVDDAAAALRGYASDGFDLVIAHGTQYGAPLQEIADDFPNVAFALGTSTDDFGKPNIFAYSVDAGQGGYVNGVIAAQLTSSDVIGVVGPVPAGDAKSYIDGFVSGVAAQQPGVEVRINYIDSFSDVLLASEAARALVAGGADVLTGTAQMVPGAIGVAQEEGVPWLGAQSNQEGLAADVVVASQVYHWDVILDQILDKIAAGSSGGEILVASLADGGIETVYNPGYPLDPAIRASADATAAGIADGSIVVPPSE